MVYIDVRDRKFQLIVVLPVVLVAIFALLAATDASDFDPLLPAVLIGGTAAIFFVIYVVVTFVLEKMAERNAEAESE